MGIYTVLADDLKGIMIKDQHPASGVPHVHENDGKYYCPTHQFTELSTKGSSKVLSCPICKLKVVGQKFKADKDKESFFKQMEAKEAEYIKWKKAKAIKEAKAEAEAAKGE